MSHSKPLPDGKSYHFNIIYNHEDSPYDATPDNRKSLECAETAVGILTTAGFDKSYYHKRDARPGRNIFDELFRVIKESVFTIVILTPGFLKNQWGKYSRQSAFKKLLDKDEDHRLKALVFGLSKADIPQGLCNHHVSHFHDNSEEDDLEWTKLIQEMSRPDEPVVTHTAVNEAGDNRLHTAANVLIAHPEGEPSLASFASSSLDMDGDRQKRVNPTYRSELVIGGAPDPVPDLVRRTESVQIDGDNDDSAGRPHTAATGSSIQRPLSSRPGASSSQAPQRRGTEAPLRGGSQPAVHEKELLTKELHAGKPVTLNITARPSPSRSPPMSMSLEASPIVSSPVISKRLPPPAQIGQNVAGSEENINNRNKNNSATAEASSSNLRTEIHAEQNTSLTDDTDLTFDDGSRSFHLTTVEIQSNEAGNVNKDNTVRNETVVDVRTQKKEVVKNETDNDHSNAAFENLQLNSLQEDTLPKELIDSGYSTEKASPEKIPQPVASLASDPVNEISSRYLFSNSYNDNESGIGDSAGASRNSSDMEELKEKPDGEKLMKEEAVNPVADHEIIVKENVSKIEVSVNTSAVSRDAEAKEDSITELKRAAVCVGSHDNQPSEVARDREETDLKRVLSEISQRSEPDGEDAGISTEGTSLRDNLEPDRVQGEHSAAYNWTLFGFKCVTRAWSRTDSLL